MAEAELLCERRGAAGLVTLNRPQALNALTHGMVLALSPRARRLGRRPGGDPHRRDRRRRARLLRRRRHPPPLRSRQGRPSRGGAALLARRIRAQRPHQALSEALCGAHRRHRHGRRRRDLASRQPSGRGRALPVRDAGGRHRLLPRRRRDLRAAAPAWRDRHLSRAHRRPGAGAPTRSRSDLRPTPCPRRISPSVTETLVAGEPVEDALARFARPPRRSSPCAGAADDRRAASPAGAFPRSWSASMPLPRKALHSLAKRPRTIRTKSPTSLAVALEQMRRGGALDFEDAMRDRVPHRVADHRRPRLLRGRPRRDHRQGRRPALAPGDARRGRC